MGYLEELELDIEDIKRWQKAIENHLEIKLTPALKSFEEMKKEAKETGNNYPDRNYYKVEDNNAN